MMHANKLYDICVRNGHDSCFLLKHVRCCMLMVVTLNSVSLSCLLKCYAPKYHQPHTNDAVTKCLIRLKLPRLTSCPFRWLPFMCDNADTMKLIEFMGVYMGKHERQGGAILKGPLLNKHDNIYNMLSYWGRTTQFPLTNCRRRELSCPSFVRFCSRLIVEEVAEELGHRLGQTVPVGIL